MPIYEYQCTACEHRLEALQKISDAPLLDCPHCDQPSLKKLVSAASFKLKGSGWYETDFKNKGKESGDKSQGTAGDGKAASGTQGSAKDESGKKAESGNAAGPASSSGAAKKNSETASSSPAPA